MTEDGKEGKQRRMLMVQNEHNVKIKYDAGQAGRWLVALRKRVNIKNDLNMNVNKLLAIWD